MEIQKLEETIRLRSQLLIAPKTISKSSQTNYKDRVTVIPFWMVDNDLLITLQSTLFQQQSPSYSFFLPAFLPISLLFPFSPPLCLPSSFFRKCALSLCYILGTM